MHKFSRFLSYVLRHAPESIGLHLDGNGWASIDDLVVRAAHHGKHLTPELIRRIVATSDKQRFALSPDGRFLRANQGHTITGVDLGLQSVEPPEFLFHGTALRFLPSIRANGLRPGQRNHVHLSTDEATARRVGQRHGQPKVLTVMARTMFQRGFEFYLAANGIWLTKNVPTKYITSA